MLGSWCEPRQPTSNRLARSVGIDLDRASRSRSASSRSARWTIRIVSRRSLSGTPMRFSRTRTVDWFTLFVADSPDDVKGYLESTGSQASVSASPAR